MSDRILDHRRNNSSDLDIDTEGPSMSVPLKAIADAYSPAFQVRIEPASEDEIEEEINNNNNQNVNNNVDGEDDMPLIHPDDDYVTPGGPEYYNDDEMDDFDFEDAYFEDGKVYINDEIVGTIQDDGALIDLNGVVIGAVAAESLLQVIEANDYYSDSSSRGNSPSTSIDRHSNDSLVIPPMMSARRPSRQAVAFAAAPKFSEVKVNRDENRETIFSKKNGNECSWDEGMLDIKRLYIAVKWLLSKNLFRKAIDGEIEFAPPRIDDDDLSDPDGSGIIDNASNTGTYNKTRRQRALSKLVDDMKAKEEEAKEAAAKIKPVRQPVKVKKERRHSAVVTSPQKPDGTNRLVIYSETLDRLRKRRVSLRPSEIGAKKNKSSNNNNNNNNNMNDDNNNNNKNNVNSNKKVSGLDLQVPNGPGIVEMHSLRAKVGRNQRRASLCVLPQQDQTPLREKREKMLKNVTSDLLSENEDPLQILNDNSNNFVTSLLEASEHEAYEHIWQGLHGHNPLVRPQEHHFYEQLIILLNRKAKTAPLFAYTNSRYNSTNNLADKKLLSNNQNNNNNNNYNNNKDEPPLHEIIPNLQRIIRSFRKMENDPHSWHRGGFLHLIDNYLAVLLYRRNFDLNIDVNAVMKSSIDNENDIKSSYVNPQKLDWIHFLQNRKPFPIPSIFVGLVFIIMMGLILFWLWHEWDHRTYNTMMYSEQLLNERMLNLVGTYILPKLQDIYGIGELGQGSISLEWINPTNIYNNGLDNADPLLVNMLNLFNVTSIYYGMNNGLFLGAFKDLNDVNEQIYINNVDSTSINNLKKCMNIYKISSTTNKRDETNGIIEASNLNNYIISNTSNELLSNCPSGVSYNIHHQKWYLDAINKNATGWIIDDTFTSSTTIRKQLSYVRTIFDNSLPIGVIRIDLDVNDFNRLLNDVSISDHTTQRYLYITHRQNIIASTTYKDNNNNYINYVYNNRGINKIDDIENIEIDNTLISYKILSYDIEGINNGDKIDTVIDNNNIISSQLNLVLFSQVTKNLFLNFLDTNDGISITMAIISICLGFAMCIYAYRDNDNNSSSMDFISEVTTRPRSSTISKRGSGTSKLTRQMTLNPKMFQNVSVLSEQAQFITKIWRMPKGFHLVVFSILFILTTLMTIFFVWTISSNDHVNETKNDVMTKLMWHQQYLTEQFIDNTQKMLNLNYNLGKYGYIDLTNSYQKYLIILLYTFRLYDKTFGIERLNLVWENNMIDSIEVNPSTLKLLYSKKSINSLCLNEYELNIKRGNYSNNNYILTPIFIINMNDVTNQQYSCIYQPKNQNWYINSRVTNNIIYSGLYTYKMELNIRNQYFRYNTLKNSLGITYSNRFGNQTNILNGVLGVDLVLDKLNSNLQNMIGFGNGVTRVISGNQYPSEAFFIERSSLFLVASTSNQISENIGDYVVPLKATNSSNIPIKRTAVFLSQVPNLINTLSSSIVIDRSFSSPITGTFVLSNINDYPDWIGVIIIPSSEFYGEIESASRIGFLFCCFVLFTIGCFVSASFLKFSQKVFSIEQNRENNTIEQLGDDEIDREHLYSLMVSIRPVILEAANNLKDCPTNQVEAWESIDFDRLHAHYTKVAINHMKECRKGRNILTLSALRERDSQRPLQLYRLYTLFTYRILIYLVICVHVCLVFAQPATPSEMKKVGPPVWLVIVEFFCILIETLDLGLKILIVYVYETSNVLTPREDTFITIIRTGLIFAIFFDWLLALSAWISFQYIIPLRPILLVLRIREVRDAALNFFRTLWAARDVILLYFLTVILGTIMGILLFRNEISSSVKGEPSSFFTSDVRTIHRIMGVDEYSFINFVHALTTIFIFTTTGENFTQLVYPAYDRSPWLTIYFVVFILFGMFMVLAMVIGTFEQGFRRMEEENLHKQTMFSRVGAVSAFVLLDLEMNGQVPRRECEYFLKRLSPFLKKDNKTLEELLKKKGSETIDIGEFVSVVEEVSWRKSQDDFAVSYELTWWRKLFYRFFEGRWYPFIALYLMMLNIFVFCLYGSYDKEGILDLWQTVLLVIFYIELILRIHTYSPTRFWYYAHCFEDSDAITGFQSEEEKIALNRARNRRGSIVQERETVRQGERRLLQQQQQISNRIMAEIEREYQMFANRAELVIMLVSLIVLIIAIGASNDPDIIRFTMTIPCLRILVLIKSIRQLMFAVVNLLPAFTPVMIFLGVVLIIYGILGVTLFAEKFVTLLQNEAPNSNFNTLGQALLTLFQLFTGEGWEKVMYAGIETTSWAATYYFISFIVIVTLLFGNLFKALFLDIKN